MNPVMNPEPKYAKPILAVLLFAGLVVSILLSNHFYDLRSGTGSFSASCNVSETVNCDSVAGSSFSELLPGLPLSSFAGGWYLGFLILVLTAFMGTQIPALLWILGSGIGLLFSGAYLYIMIAKIGAYCLQCLTIDGINVALFGVSLWIARGSRAAATKITHGLAKNLVIIAGSVLFTVVFMKSFDRSSLEGVTHRELSQSVLAGSPVSVGAGAEYPFIGSEKAKITVVEFSDFQCPHCQHGAKILHAVASRYPSLIKIVFRSFPLDPACNPEIKGGGHGISCEATKVAFCAAKQGKFKAVYEAIFDHQAELTAGLPMKLAKELGLSESELQTCVDGPEVSGLIARSLEEGMRLGVKSTPTYFVNGHRMEGAYPVPVWIDLVEALQK